MSALKTNCKLFYSMNNRSETIVGLKSFLTQQYLQCTHSIVTFVNKVIQELSITTQHYSFLIILGGLYVCENNRRQ